ncbi:MAG: G5 domain-containing protein [Anaerolineae bacterium]|jgi:uncharacterized protein YabE (DUF348 family)|nr:G5 domain-containing protein [Anaerolineae bacterium]
MSQESDLSTPRIPWRTALFAAFVCLILAFALIVGLMRLTQREHLPQTVALQIDGQIETVISTASTVGDLLDERGIIPPPNAVIAPPLNSALSEGMTIAVGIERAVRITRNGNLTLFRTVYDRPLDILDSMGILLDPRDAVQVNGISVPVSDLATYPLPATEITIRESFRVFIDQEGVITSHQTTAFTVSEALSEVNIPIFLGDTIIPDPTALLTPDLTIVVRRSVPITIRADGIVTQTRTQASTVSLALAQLGITLNGLDYSLPPEASPIQSDLEIQVVRVTEIIESIESPIAFETVYQADDALELDQRQVIQAGVDGIEQLNTRIRLEDGVEVSRVEDGVTVVRAPVNQVIAYGTKIVIRTVDTPDGPREYWRVLRMYATSYHPAALGGDNITATGRRLTKGIVAIDPRVIPYNTEVYVPNYGIGTAADTGGPRSTRYWIDLGYDDENWVSWSRWIDVYVLTPVPPEVQYLLPAR